MHQKQKNLKTLRTGYGMLWVNLGDPFLANRVFYELHEFTLAALPRPGVSADLCGGSDSPNQIDKKWQEQYAVTQNKQV